MKRDEAHEWEGRFLASCMMEPAALDRVSVADFASPSFAAIFGAMLVARSKTGDVAGLAVKAELERVGKGDLSSKLLDLTGRLDVDPVTTSERVRELAASRRLHTACQLAGEQARTGDLPGARETLHKATSFDPGHDEDRVYTHREMLAASLEAIVKQSDANFRKYVRLGLGRFVDDAFQAGPGDLCVIAAQTNVGKSTLIVDAALDLADRAIPVGIVSIEDPVEDFGAKFLGRIGGVNPADFWRPPMDPETRDKLALAFQSGQADKPMTFAKVKSRRLDGVVAKMDQMARVNGARVIFVDYLQGIRHPSFGSKLQTRECINDSLATLMAAAARLDVALVLASQLSRPEAANPFREPTMHHLKESSSIEECAQCIVMLWRTTDDPGHKEYGLIRGKLAKAKRSPVGARWQYRRAKNHRLVAEAMADDFGNYQPGYSP